MRSIETTSDHSEMTFSLSFGTRNDLPETNVGELPEVTATAGSRGGLQAMPVILWKMLFLF